jgi:hypothetical protein
MSQESKRRPELIGAKVADNTVFRVYDPPRDIAAGGVGEGYRDFKIASVDFGADGTMVLHSVVKVGESPDLRPKAPFGGKVEEWRHLIAAVIDSNGHLRAESIVLPDSPDGEVN